MCRHRHASNAAAPVLLSAGKALLDGSLADRAARHGAIALGGFRMADALYHVRSAPPCGCWQPRSVAAALSLIPFFFPPRQVLLGRCDELGLDDLRHLDPVLHSSLAHMLAMPVEGVFFESFAVEEAHPVRAALCLRKRRIAPRDSAAPPASRPPPPPSRAPRAAPSCP